ncbi:efflux RND transporter periplasmic adaptor subunit [Palleronia sp. LCG004]|uniref:efflux RND transporter periplasmic adaptor subunit n=1 Tax=Palleronia sp. LCG004 TaxID=3079304 RepID=UPI0029426F1E|nr:efflux RND transporter periplasmic adaptor subunit [Palleronia sp. LCG004]WOI56300.1 efflux RND transporter periplasmic adaptor subunit [Palleronia sp. LCG004]
MTAFHRLLLIAFLVPSLAAAQEQILRPVKLMELAAGDGIVERQFFGRVRARDTVDLAFQVGGQIVEFPVAEGAPLPAGTLVAQLNSEPFERGLRRAEVNLAKAERDLARLRELSGSSVSDVQIRDAETTRDLAEIAAEEARDALEDATLRTTFDALVARREVANQTTISAGQPVVRLHDMSELRVDIDVPEVLFREADGTSITFEASFPGSSESYDLVLREFEAETTDITQTFTITLAFDEEVPSWVLPGATATVTARLEDEADDLIVPEGAIVFDAARDPGVMVFEPSQDDPDLGVVNRVPVAISVNDDAGIVLTEGPEPGAFIVSSGASQLEDGQRVRRYTGLGN